MAWEKVLYRNQDYPDNYVEPSYFLKELKRNLYTPTYTLRELVFSSECVVRPFTSVCLFVCLHFYSKEGWINPFVLFTICTSLAFFFALAFTEDVMKFLQPSLFLHGFLCGVAPILCTLTQSISDDTLWAMTVGMLIFHLIFYNYKQTNPGVFNAISLNAAVFAAVCLASMMNAAFDGFVLVSVAINLFVFSPKYNDNITVYLLLTTMILLLNTSLPATLFFLVMIVSLSLIFPMWLCSLQNLKNNIYGPWDEAVIHEDDYAS